MKEIKLKQLKNLNLLILEDNEDFRENLETMTSIFFKEIFVVSNGTDGLKLFENKNIDVIIVDYVMPIMDGYEFSKKIRDINDSIPIVMLSNCSDKEKLLNMITLNLTDYIIKPINYSVLTETLLKIVEKLEKYSIIKIFIDKDIEYDTSTKKIIINDKIQKSLTRSESDILELLIKNKNKIVTTDMIDNIFDIKELKTNSAIRNHIYKLRKKIDKDIILNIKEIGYILKMED